MKFPEFRRKYENKNINLEDLILTVCPKLFTIASIAKVIYDKPDNPLYANIEIFLKNPVYLERKPSVGYHMPGIIFNENHIDKILNRNEQIYYFVAQGPRKLSDIFIEQVSMNSPINSIMNTNLTNHFKTIIEYMETTNKITDEDILEILESRPEFYHNL